MKSTLLTIALFVAAAAAQSTTPFYFTNPIQGTSYSAGDKVELDWINGLDQAVTVELLTGTSSATMTPIGDSFSVEGSSGQYEWTVPTDLPQNATFSFMITYVDSTGSSKQSFSAPFTISDTTGDVVTQSFVTASATSSILTASASATIRSAISSASSASIVVPSTSLPLSSAAASASASASASATPSKSGATAKKASLMAAGAIAVLGAALLF